MKLYNAIWGAFHLFAPAFQNDLEDNAEIETKNGMTQGDKLRALKLRRQPRSATTGALR